jgi:conjugative relaxase-like TrwC/TraI family protein
VEGDALVISIRRVSLGGGFRYLMDSVARGDGAPDPSSPLAAYYAASGTPPGIFLGAGLAELDGGRGVAPRSVVTEEHLSNMLVALVDPVSGEPLGGSPKAPRGGVPVAGFDLTFSPSKSVSVAWALGDEVTRAAIFEAHRRAIDEVLAYAERHVIRSRSGTNGIVEEDVTGVIATAFTHYSSRSGDPQLHDHVVLWNRARSVSDGRWRTLDSRTLFKATTTLSELHQGVLSDLLTEALGVGWEERRRRHSERPRYEIAGVKEALMAEFSKRSGQIAEESAQLRGAFVAAHGRAPTAVEDMALHQQATIATREKKAHHSLAELTRDWRDRAASHVPLERQTSFVKSLRDRNDLPLLRAGDLGEAMLKEAADAVVRAVAERHATYGRHNLLAEAHRILHGVRFRTPEDRLATAEAITQLAIAASLVLTPPPLHHTPSRYLRSDGTSRLHPEHRIRYSTSVLLEAEARLLEAGRALDGPTAGVADDLAVPSSDTETERVLGHDQADAIREVATSGRFLDVLVGPAGSGKSTAMARLRAVWEAAHGAGSVPGLAPSASAAEVLGDELGISTENTAKWLTEWRRVPGLVAQRRELAARLARSSYPASAFSRRLAARLAELDRAIEARRLRPGQLVIVDEASMASTLALDELVGAAREAGAKVLLVGDPAQLGAVEAGGAFSLLVADRREQGGHVPELTEVRRFRHPWEATASTALRAGSASAIDAYETHARIAGGDREAMLLALYEAWRSDVEAGRSSCMIAADNASVAALNLRARAGRIAAGAVSSGPFAREVVLADGERAGVGDEVVTRRNDRRIPAGASFVKNGDRWVIEAVHEDGSIDVRRLLPAGRHVAGRDVILPAGYVASHVELAYATTAYRAQGRTVDTAHVLVSPTTTRELLYVAATRGREANHLYVETTFDPDPATSHDELVEPQHPREVLLDVLANESAEVSVHGTIHREHAEAEHMARLAAEYATLAAAAQEERFDALLGRCGLSWGELASVRQSEARGPLFAALREAEARGLEISVGLPRLVAARSLEGAADLAAVLHSRVDRWMRTAAPSSKSADLVVGLFPRASGVKDAGMASALEERAEAMERRAEALIEQAVERGGTWIEQLGTPPADNLARARWIRSASVVAAYRERWGIDDPSRVLGPDVDGGSVEQGHQAKRAAVALKDARMVARLSTDVRAEPAEPVGLLSEVARGVEL